MAIVRHSPGPHRTTQAGQALLWFILAIPLLLLISGLAIDGGRFFAEQIRLHNIAEAAAHSAAQQIDQSVFRDNGTVVLNPQLVEEAVAGVCAAESERRCTYEVSLAMVSVRVEEEMQTTFFQWLGLATLPVSASAHAQIEYGR